MENNINNMINSNHKIETYYANRVEISGSTYDFEFKFGKASTLSENPVYDIMINMSPQHAKALLYILAENIQNYEKTFGEIVIVEKDK